ncbi:hypothetical protein ACDA63_04955 [Uliginosibacterium sp. sgz301328]|uniref:hypothetical protein n=1 Tax=Uliginosibacterium sp. sgz301328 TaxID=3243764 RepID=UPI00359E3C60
MMIRPICAALCLAAISAQAADVVSMPRTAAYSDIERIALNVRSECSLPEYQAKAIQQAFAAADIEVAAIDGVQVPAKGAYLVPLIDDAYSGGNAFIGHRKMVRLKAVLYIDGQKAANFSGMRDSMGGAFGGFKGSCEVLERCADTLSKDLLKWYRAQRAAMSLPSSPAPLEAPAP